MCDFTIQKSRLLYKHCDDQTMKTRKRLLFQSNDMIVKHEIGNVFGSCSVSFKNTYSRLFYDDGGYRTIEMRNENITSTDEVQMILDLFSYQKNNTNTVTKTFRKKIVTFSRRHSCKKKSFSMTFDHKILRERKTSFSFNEDSKNKRYLLNKRKLNFLTQARQKHN